MHEVTQPHSISIACFCSSVDHYCIFQFIVLVQVYYTVSQLLPNFVAVVSDNCLH